MARQVEEVVRVVPMGFPSRLQVEEARPNRRQVAVHRTGSHPSRRAEEEG